MVRSPLTLSRTGALLARVLRSSCAASLAAFALVATSTAFLSGVNELPSAAARLQCQGSAPDSLHAWPRTAATRHSRGVVACSEREFMGRSSSTQVMMGAPSLAPAFAACAMALWVAGARRVASAAQRQRRDLARRAGKCANCQCSTERDEQGENAEDEDEQELVVDERTRAACEKLQSEIEELKGAVLEKRSAYERLNTEVENFRARTRQELAAARGQAAIPIIMELLPVADEFELAKQNLTAETDGERAICDRFDSLFARMVDTWSKLGVERLEVVGKEFDPALHEAISMTHSEDYEANVVCSELRGGWVFKASGASEKQVLRHALVCVSSGPGPS
eukprot:TRINITY_DN20389_c0_g1_i1.p1 TRINITY_DN20389_c0_g1~~TRINITY_DN20389_c0_g1_i1.p1  ORF type:complete len:338 (-),score=54.59 TRINITY_DN20389_c0_g1_i1:126-1139(-)